MKLFLRSYLLFTYPFTYCNNKHFSFNLFIFLQDNNVCKSDICEGRSSPSPDITLIYEALRMEMT
jgi:hypothetical protein